MSDKDVIDREFDRIMSLFDIGIDAVRKGDFNTALLAVQEAEKSAKRLPRKKGTLMIFKVQRPMVANHANAPWYAYTKDRGQEVFIPSELVTDDLLAVMGDNLKCYVEAELQADGTFVVKRQVADQEW